MSFKKNCQLLEASESNWDCYRVASEFLMEFTDLDSVLDIGAGDGVQADIFVERGFRYFGLDMMEHDEWKIVSDKANFDVGFWPNIEKIPNTKVAISFFSIGQKKGENPVIDMDLVREQLLAIRMRFGYLFIAGWDEVINEAKELWPRCEEEDSFNGRVYFLHD